VFGNHGRAEHRRWEDPSDQRRADRGALLPPMGRLQKGSAHEPHLRHRRGRANRGSDAWERRRDTTFSLEPPPEEPARETGMRPRSGERPAIGSHDENRKLRSLPLDQSACPCLERRSTLKPGEPKKGSPTLGWGHQGRHRDRRLDGPRKLRTPS
jgi:hypothetical protein